MANPILLITLGPTVTGWAVLLEFIVTLAMALRCYPLQPGGLIALQAVLIGLTTPESAYEEVVQALPVLLLLMFMVAGIYFLRELLLERVHAMLLRIRSSSSLSLVICVVAAVLSAFLDALTVVAVMVTIGLGFYECLPSGRFGKRHDDDHDPARDEGVSELHAGTLEQFRAFLRGLMMHAAVGTAIGGVMTQVGEPQNLLIAKQADWDLRAVLPGGRAGVAAGRRRRVRDLLGGRPVPAVRLRRPAAGRGPRHPAIARRRPRISVPRRATGRC